jgi:hypothetical protein
MPSSVRVSFWVLVTSSVLSALPDIHADIFPTKDRAPTSRGHVSAIFQSTSGQTASVQPKILGIMPSAAVGSTFDLTIRGSGFDPTGAVEQVYQPNGSQWLQGTVKSRSATEIVVTESMAGAAPFSQPYLVKVKNPDGQLSNGAPLTLHDEVSVSPDSGAVGTVFRHIGRGFAGSRTAISHLKRPDGKEFVPIQVAIKPDGTFSRTINSVVFAVGTYEIWAIDGDTGASSAHATFVVR